MKTPLRIISYGGGVQSTAMIVLATQGIIPNVDAALFSNVGDDSEHPDTLVYVREIMQPWAAERGFPVHELNRTLKTGEVQTLYGRIMNHEGPTLREPIPIRGMNGRPFKRSCTADHKIKVLGKWIKAQDPERLPAEVLIGISTDEYMRANRGRDEKWERRTYPLIDLDMTRTDCMKVISDAGLPVPPKSSCYFCPFHSIPVWQELRRDRPDLFEKAAELEDTMNARRAAREKDPVYLTRKGRPLREVITLPEPGLFEPENFNDGKCDEGYCWT